MTISWTQNHQICPFSENKFKLLSEMEFYQNLLWKRHNSKFGSSIHVLLCSDMVTLGHGIYDTFLRNPEKTSWKCCIGLWGLNKCQNWRNLRGPWVPALQSKIISKISKFPKILEIYQSVKWYLTKIRGMNLIDSQGKPFLKRMYKGYKFWHHFLVGRSHQWPPVATVGHRVLTALY